MKKVVMLLLNLYRNYLSKFKLRTCRFHPTCSEYMREAVQKYGVFLGLSKGICRLLRCHPFSAGGYDPLK